MPHIDPERLAMLAMGEPSAAPEDPDHLAHCAICVDDLAALRHAALAGRASFDVGELESPPDAVWARIADELSLARVTAETPQTPLASRVDEIEAAHAAEPIELADVAVQRAVEPVASGRPTAPNAAAGRRAPRWTGWVLAAAVVLVAGVGLGAVFLSQQSSQTEVAEASLSAFPSHEGAAGSAVVEEGGDGALAVHVQLTASAAPDTYREVWLITADASALVSLGVLDGTEATFPVPAGVDLRDYVLVDISQEPDDGDAGHSGDSIVRGELTFL